MNPRTAGEGAARRGVRAGVCHAHGPAHCAAHFMGLKGAGGAGGGRARGHCHLQVATGGTRRICNDAVIAHLCIVSFARVSSQAAVFKKINIYSICYDCRETPRENCWVQYSHLCAKSIAILFFFFFYMFLPSDTQPCAGSECSQGISSAGDGQTFGGCCVSSSGFLLYRWDFIWDFASERQAAALGREGRQRRGCWRKSSGARAHRQKNHLLEKINEQKSQRCPCNASFPGAGCGGCFRERRGAVGAAGTGREQLPFPWMKLQGDAETQHKFPGWSLARTPGLVLPPPAASATRLLTTGGGQDLGFTSYLFVEEKIKGLTDSYEIPSSGSSGDWSQINSRLRSSIRGEHLGK